LNNYSRHSKWWIAVPLYLRLEDRIRSLSEKLVEAEGKEFQRLAIELRTAISEYVERLKTLSRYPSVHRRRFDDKLGM
jgi:hypothetical protein